MENSLHTQKLHAMEKHLISDIGCNLLKGLNEAVLNTTDIKYTQIISFSRISSYAEPLTKVCRDCWKSSSPTSSLKHDHLENVAQNCVQITFYCL